MLGKYLVYFFPKSVQARVPQAPYDRLQTLTKVDNTKSPEPECPADYYYSGTFDEEVGIWIWQNPQTGQWEGILHGQDEPRDAGRFGEQGSLNVVLL